MFNHFLSWKIKKRGRKIKDRRTRIRESISNTKKVGRVIDIFFEKNAEFYESSQDEVCFMVEIERISEQIKSRKGRIAELREEIKALQ